jgi:hypothetical protein
LVAGRVVVRDEEGRLTLSSFRFLPLGGQAAALGAKQPVRCKRFVADNKYELTPISVRILIAWEKGKEALELPAGGCTSRAQDHVLILRASEKGSYRSISRQDTEKNLLPKANTLPIPETKSSNAPGSGTATGPPL